MRKTSVLIMMMVLTCISSFRVDAQSSNTSFRLGDVNNDQSLNITDAVTILNYLFLNGNEFSCRRAVDVNKDDFVNLTDAVFMLHYLFLSGSPIAEEYILSENCDMSDNGENGYEGEEHILGFEDGDDILIDGEEPINGKMVNAGDRIILSPAEPDKINEVRFDIINLHGEPGKPITITNFRDGAVKLSVNGRLDINHSSHIRFIGNNSPYVKYGIQLYDGRGIRAQTWTSDIEIAYIKLKDVESIAIKYIDGEDRGTTREEGTDGVVITHHNALIHDNLVINSSAEGLYIGNNFMSGDAIRIDYAEVYNNCVLNAGWDGINIKSVDGGKVYNNLTNNSGSTDDPEVSDSQKDGIAISQSANHIETYDNVVFNSVIDGLSDTFGDREQYFDRGGNITRGNIIMGAGRNALRVRLDPDDEVRDNLAIDADDEDIDIEYEGGDRDDVSGNRDSGSGSISDLRREAQDRFEQLYNEICVE